MGKGVCRTLREVLPVIPVQGTLSGGIPCSCAVRGLQLSSMGLCYAANAHVQGASCFAGIA